MPIRKPKPTSPGRRFVILRRLRRGHPLGAREVAHRGAEEVRRTKRARPQDVTPPWRRRQAPVPQDRLQAPQGRDPGEGRPDRVRPQPVRLHRAAALRRRREELHPGSPAAAGGGHRQSGESADIRVGNSLPLANMPPGTVVHNVELTPGRGGQMARSAGAGVQLLAKDGDYATLRLPVRGNADGPGRVPRDGRHDRELRPPERQDRQGRPQAPHGRAAADARNRDEPGRPPPRRWRGLDHAGPPSVTPWGVPTLGYRTRKKGKKSDQYIVRGRRRGKKR